MHQKIFSLKNMWKIEAFLLLAKIGLGTISRSWHSKLAHSVKTQNWTFTYFCQTKCPLKTLLLFFIDFLGERPCKWVFGPKNMGFSCFKNFFDKKTCVKFFFPFRICEKLKLFCYWQNLVLAPFLGPHLLSESVFQLSRKEIMVAVKV